MVAFAKAFHAGTLRPILQSESIPPETDNNSRGLVRPVVGWNFNEVVVEAEDQDVLVLFYHPGCQHCAEVMTIFEDVAARLKPAPSIALVKLDASKNEVHDLVVRGTPTVRLWRAGLKEDPLDYARPYDLWGFMDFLKDHAMSDVEWSQVEIPPRPEDEEGREGGGWEGEVKGDL